MRSLVKRYRLNEAYSLQQYEGKVRDAIVSEVKELNKNAILICLFIYKFKMFMTSRTIHDRGLNCSLTLIYYDEDSGIPKDDYIDGEDSDYFVGPDSVDGATANDKVMVYVPITLDFAPFATGYMNEYCTDNIYKACTQDLNLMHCIVNVDNYNSIGDTLKSLRDRYSDNIEDFIDSLPDECAHAKKTVNVDTNYILKTVKHEFTHVLDQHTASHVNHFSGIGIDDVDKHGLDLALDILYKLWSWTEFNAFTQTFSQDTDRERSIKPDFINKVSLKYLSRPCADGGTIDLEDHINEINDSLNELSHSEYDEDFWDAIRCIVVEGSRDSNAKARYDSMSPMKFRNYFIKTTRKLIEKFKNKLVKNIASQNIYNNDVSKIAARIRDAAGQAMENYEAGDLVELNFNFDCYFKKKDLSCRVYVNTETAYYRRYHLNNSSISGNSLIHIMIDQMNIRYDEIPDRLFGSASNSFVELYKEITTKQRKSMINKWCINFAEDLLNTLNHIVK